MDVSLLPVWMTSLSAVAGVVYSIWRNGSRTKKQNDQLMQELKSELGNIKTQLNDRDSGLAAIKKSTDEIRLHCAQTSTSIALQTKTNAEEIAKLRMMREAK